MLLATFASAVVLLGAVPTGYREIPVRIEPPQDIKAVAIRSGDEVLSVSINGGNALVPSTLRLPWTVSLSRFEATTYTLADLEQQHPLILRELGSVHGVLRRPKDVKGDDRFTFLLWRVQGNGTDHVDFVVGASGGFNFRVPAGLYHGAAIGERSGTRIRSAIVVHPAETTEVGELIVEPTARVSIHVVDQRREPIAGATVAWAPPSALNSEVAKMLYATRWSGVTDRRGTVVFASVGPPPIPLRWKVSAKGFASEVTRPLELLDSQSISLPDVSLRPQAIASVRITLPKRGIAELRHGRIVLGEPDDANPLKFIPRASAALREGEVRFESLNYGKKRLWIETALGRRVLFQDFDIRSEVTVVNLTPEPIDIHGQVKRGGEPVSNAYVRLADPHDAKTILAFAQTDSSGDYRLTAFQTGKLSLYAIESNTPGMQSYPVTKDIDTNGAIDYAVDFQLPDSRATVLVLDSETGEPLRAVIDKRMTFSDGTSQMGLAKTGSDGRLVLNGFPSGTAHLYIKAPGHYSREIDIALDVAPAEIVVRLDKSNSILGRVVDLNGLPIAGARITGGYSSETVRQPPFETTSDQDGAFHFDFAPEIGTIFYVIAPNYSLGITTLQPDHDNTVALTTPRGGGFYLMPGNAPPKKLYLVMASPAGGDYIPLGVLSDLGEANGLSLFQLVGTAKDGSVALPEFLPPGNYSLYIALKGGKPCRYQKVGSVSLPADQNSVLTFSEQ